MSPAVVVRPRRDGDVDALAGVLVEVHALDGYPVEGVGDPGAWLRPDQELGAWVAELDGVRVGHVALTEPGPGDTAADLWTRQENAPADAVAVLGRLFVSPAARGHHLGAKLATAATDHAHRLGRRAVLDVMVKDVAAIHTYEALGWEALGRFDHHLGEGRSEPAVGYVSPRPATSRRTTNVAADGFMIQRRDTRPRYQQIAADVRSQIMSGVLAPGTKLPSTLQLVERYGAANATVQRALAALKDEGFLDGHMGKGVFVRQALPLVVDVAAFLDPRAPDYSYDILHVREEEPPADVQRALGRPEGSMAVVRARVLSHGGEPVELSHSYYPAEIAAGTPLADHAKIRGGAPRLLADLGYPQREFVDRVSTRMPTTDELQVLNIPDDVPIIRQLRVIYSADGHAVEVSVLVKPGHFYELRYHQRIEQ